MRVEPLGDKIVVRRIEVEDKTAGGIFLPDSAREKPQQGRVLAVGRGRMLKDGQRSASQVNEGDRVIFSTWGGSEITIDEEELLILSEEDILAVVE